MSPQFFNQPHWPHDCESCVFIAGVRLNQRYDVYFCPKCDGGTWLARYGPDAPNYASMMASLIYSQILTSYEASEWDGHHYRATTTIIPWEQAVLLTALHKCSTVQK